MNDGFNEIAAVYIFIGAFAGAMVDVVLRRWRNRR